MATSRPSTPRGEARSAGRTRTPPTRCCCRSWTSCSRTPSTSTCCATATTWSPPIATAGATGPGPESARVRLAQVRGSCPVVRRGRSAPAASWRSAMRPWWPNRRRSCAGCSRSSVRPGTRRCSPSTGPSTMAPSATAKFTAERREQGGDGNAVYQSRVGAGRSSLDPVLRTMLRRSSGRAARRAGLQRPLSRRPPHRLVRVPGPRRGRRVRAGPDDRPPRAAPPPA